LRMGAINQSILASLYLNTLSNFYAFKLQIPPEMGP